MMKIFTKLFKQKDSTCQECDECMEKLQLIIDGEADNHEEKFFTNHIDECVDCMDKYNIEKSIIDNIRAKMEKKPCPDKLISSIQNQIKSANIQ